MTKFTVPQLKDAGILLAWIGAMLLIGCLCWSLTRSFRADLLRQSVNRSLVRIGDTRSLDKALAPGVLKPQLNRMGTWYTMKDGNRALVFTMIADGVFIPCTAIVNTAGKLEEILPLSAVGARLLERVSPGIIKLYTRRIEGGT